MHLKYSVLSIDSKNAFPNISAPQGHTIISNSRREFLAFPACGEGGPSACGWWMRFLLSKNGFAVFYVGALRHTFDPQTCADLG